ncbi:MAG: GTP-binding protein [Clostridium sp.]
MKKTFGIFAHVDSGKTTFSEQILFNTNTIRTRGRVDHKDSFLDSHKIERERGITVFSDVGVFEYKGDEYYLLDTPGHIDFSPEMERVIPTLDFAVLVICGVSGVLGHSETVWRLLRKHKIPTFIFINKMDREGADLNRVLSDIKSSLSEGSFLYKRDLENEDIECIAEKDEELLEEYFENGYNKELWKKKIEELTFKGEIFPVVYGSALNNEGILESLECFNEVFKTSYEEEVQFKGRVFKVRYDEKGNRIVFMKCLGGKLKVKDEVSYIVNGEEKREKINSIRKYNGEKFVSIDEGKAGEIFGVIGLSEIKSGDGINIKGIKDLEMVPSLKARVLYDKEVSEKEVYRIFKLLESEEGTLNVTFDEDLKELHISIMGKIQLEVLKEILLDRFNLVVDFLDPEILYKETIRGEVEGFGHFEPLKHYAEVHLKLEEGKRGEGITFTNLCHNDFLSPGNQNLIRTHIFEKEHRGILTGSSLTDLKITLITGRSHNKHTSGGDFREATKRALRQGLEKGECVLLEPFYEFKMEISSSLIGRVLSDIQRLNGEFNEPITKGDNVIICGRGPVSKFMNYPLEFQTFTKGKGKISFRVLGYFPCHNESEVVERIGYNKNADREYTSTSIFCSKGESFLVPWDECEKYMHCLE